MEGNPWEMDWTGVKVDAGPVERGNMTGGQGVGTRQQEGTAAQKLLGIRALRGALGRVEKEFRDLDKPVMQGGWDSGLIGGYLPTEEGQQFDAAVSQVAPLIRQLTRVPGEGSMSDYESKLAAAGLPSRTTYNSVTRQQIEGMKQIIADYEAATQQFLQGEVPAPTAVAPRAPQARPAPARPMPPRPVQQPARKPMRPKGGVVDFNDL